jgi:hypothetical protein
VPLVAELGQDHEDPVGPLAAQLDVLVLATVPADLDHLAAVPLDRLGLAADHIGHRLRPQGTALVLQRAGQIVHPGLRSGNRRDGLDRWCRLGHRREQNSDAGDHRGAEQSCDYFAHHALPPLMGPGAGVSDRHQTAPGFGAGGKRMQSQRLIRLIDIDQLRAMENP